MYFPGVEAYFKLTEDLRSNTRLRWGGTCLFQHPGWHHVFWDMEAATKLIATVSRSACVRLCHVEVVVPGWGLWGVAGGRSNA